MTDIRDEVAAALDSDDFRDRHERAMRDHILGAVDFGVEHRCDDLCSDAILSRLLGKHAVNEYPWQPDAARGLTVVREDWPEECPSCHVGLPARVCPKCGAAVHPVVREEPLPVPPYHDDRGDLQEAWQRGYRAARGLTVVREGELRTALLSIPQRVYQGANRYDTDDTHTLHLWADGQSWDIICPKVATDDAIEVERLEAALTDMLGEVGFMRSCIASGERLSRDDFDRQHEAMGRAAALLTRLGHTEKWSVVKARRLARQPEDQP